MRCSDGRSRRLESSIQIRPPPAPQQNVFDRLRGISTSQAPIAPRTSRGAAVTSL
jgi:hypothetical protein